MEENGWIIWMVLAAIFIIGEIFTAGFFLLWFGIGAAAAGVAALFGFSVGWQLGIFVFLSGILFAVSRKFSEKITKEQPPGIGADRYADKEGIVLEEIDNTKNTGRIRIESEEWNAKSQSAEMIPLDSKVKVIEIVGTHVVVKILKEGE